MKDHMSKSRKVTFSLALGHTRIAPRARGQAR